MAVIRVVGGRSRLNACRGNNFRFHHAGSDQSKVLGGRENPGHFIIVQILRLECQEDSEPQYAFSSELACTVTFDVAPIVFALMLEEVRRSVSVASDETLDQKSSLSGWGRLNTGTLPSQPWAKLRAFASWNLASELRNVRPHPFRQLDREMQNFATLLRISDHGLVAHS
jgi:hypothetical protein